MNSKKNLIDGSGLSNLDDNSSKYFSYMVKVK